MPYSDPYGASPDVRQVGAEPTVVESILSDVKSEIDQGVAFALAAPFPKPKLVTEDVYA